MYFVKREVVASTITEAMKAKGKIYAIELSDEKMWPEDKANIGFKNAKEKKDN